ncbi:MAG: tRNA (adenosine(37)-N6)-threonylcarbamoyltransferase complex ATPase subunit type 1 TsaE [Patescibacteria group bacterium]|nr:tRNA (adenosine(37)-N6)-threonylcarbamoyltransferase complex ATPase subunit type 1 TsaE [Patescibacteria group bacterium]
MKYLTKNEKETMALGKKIAATFAGGEVVALHGDLGAGKTTLAKGIAIGLGIKNKITSPTFVLMNIYQTKNKTVTELVHLDCYRINNYHEMEMIGFNEYAQNPKAVTLIEWPEKIAPLLPKIRREIFIRLRSDQQREIEIK